MNSENLKMYIAVRNDVPDHMVPVLVAHAVLGDHLENRTYFNINPNLSYQKQYVEWQSKSFKKCVVRVNEKEFEKIKRIPGVTLHHENKTLEGKKSCAVVVVGEEIPNVLKFAKLWKPLPIQQEAFIPYENNDGEYE